MSEPLTNQMQFPCDLSQDMLPDEIDVVEDDQPARGVVAEEADVGGQRVGGRKIPDRAVAVDIDLRGRNRVDKAIDHAAAIGNAYRRLRLRRDGAQQQHCESEQQDFDPAAARPRIVRVARSHLRPRPITRRIRRRGTEAVHAGGLDSGGPAVVGPYWAR